MIPHLDVHALFGAISMPLYWMLSNNSMQYHIFKYDIDELTLSKFIDELSWPLRLSYQRGNQTVKSLSSVYIERGWSPLQGALVNRILGVISLSFMPVVYSITLHRADTTPEIISAAAGLLISSYLLYRAWFFGHKLKDMQAAASNEEADTN